jgi:AsmA protein
MRKLLIIGSAIAGLLIVAVLAAALLLDANQFRPRLESLLGTALGRKLTIANIRVAIMSGGIALEGVTIADDPAFSDQPFVTATSVRAGVDLVPLLVSRDLRVQSFHLDEPHVVLRRSASGTWNFSSLGASAPNRSSGSAAAISVLVRELRLTGGQLVVENAARGEASRVYEDVSLDATNLSYTSPFPFRITARTPGDGTAAIEGQAGPLDLGNAAATPFQATAGLKQLDLGATGFVDPASGLRGVMDFAGTLTSDGARVNTRGTVRATGVQLLPGASPAPVPVTIEYESTYEPKTQRGTVTQGDLHIGNAVAHLTGTYDAGKTGTVLKMTLRGEAMPVTPLQQALPAVGVTLPAGATLKQGTLDTQLTIAGPLDRLVITGPVSLAKGLLAGFDLGGKLGALATFAGLPTERDTPIESLRADLRVAPERIEVDALSLVVPTIGTLTGDGQILPNDAMDFAMLAKLKQGALSGGVARATAFAQTSGIPFHVRGTTSRPVFTPDVGSAVKSGVIDAAKNPDNIRKAGEALGGLFRRRKPAEPNPAEPK